MNRVLLRWAVFPALGLIALLVCASAFVLWVMSASLPSESGERVLAGLAAPVMVERDALGIAVIRADTIEDAACSQGFVHAQ